MSPLCLECGAVKLHPRNARCELCYPKHTTRMFAVRACVAKAIKDGLIPRADSCVCVDCGSSAQVHDHRDYNKPLQVDPVCRSCNYKRGSVKSLGLPKEQK